MINLREYIDSGLIESYVLGLASVDEARELEELCTNYPEVKSAVEQFEIVLEQQAFATAVTPEPTIKPLVLATMNYIGRLESGEPFSNPPMLNEQSKVEDYAEWLERKDMVLPDYFEDVFARLICYTPGVTTAIVWLKEVAPAEVHHNEYEKFLVVEGSCDIVIEDEINSLVPGNFLAIPLYKDHKIKVTSKIPCKVILQRVAA